MKHSRNLLLSASILMAHRLRTTLSILGVAVGTAALVLIVSIGDGVTADIQSTFEKMGSNLVMVRAGKFREFRGRAHQMSLVTTLTEADAKALAASTPNIQGAAAAVSRGQTVKAGAISTQIQVEAMEWRGFSLRGINAATGRLYDQREDGARRTVAVLGPTVAKTLFGDTPPENRVIQIGRLPFTVIGVTEARGADINGTDQDNIVFIPIDTGVKRLFHLKFIETIYIQGNGPEVLEQIVADSTATLKKRHRIKDGQEDDFTVKNQAALLETAISSSQATTRLVMGVSAISLLVAGIGILAVMLMSVKERQWEIGLRRATGARKRDILLQFINEAALLSLAGGLTGVLLAVGCVWLVGYMEWASARFSGEAALVAFAVSATIGLIFGVYPARKAAALEPITALHSV